MSLSKNFEVTASTGDLNVLHEGRILSADVNESIVLNIKSDIVNFKLIFKFIDNGSELNTYINIEGDSFIIVCENYNNNLGTGVKKPLKLTNNSGKDLYISYTISRMSPESGHELVYTFYSN